MMKNRQSLYPYLVLALLSIVLYANTLSNDYALDDTLLITGNEFTNQGIDGINEILTNDAFTGFFGKKKNLVAGGRYRPLSQIMFAVEYELFGFNPFIGHLLNILLYLLLALSLFKLLDKLIVSRTKQWWWSLPFLASVFFIAHPLHTEAVANIKGRDEILSMLFAILAWLLLLQYMDNKKWIKLGYASVLFFLALMSKENSITFLAVVPLSFYFFRKESRLKQIWITVIPLLITTVIFLFIRYQALGIFLGGSKPTEILNDPYIMASGIEKIATNLLTWGKYYLLLVFPHPLTHDYYPHFFELTGFGNISVLLTLLVTAGLIAAALVLFRKRHIVSFGILYFFTTFSIMSNVVFNIGTFMNERFMFIPLLGFTLILAWAMVRLKAISSASILPILLSAVILAGYSVKTISRNKVWENDYTLFTTDVEVSSNSIKCNVSAGGKSLERYEQTNDKAEKQRLLNQAIPWLEKGVRLHKTYLAGWEQLGKAYFFKRDPERAWLCYKNCLEIKPGSKSAIRNLGLVAQMAMEEDKNEKAIGFFKELQEIDPGNSEYTTKLAEAYVKDGNATEALNTVLEGIRNNPEDHRLHGKAGEIYGRYLNRLDSAEAYLKEAIALKPDYTSALENLGIVYGMTGRLNASLEVLMRAHEIEPENDRILQNIGNTLTNMGRTSEAQEYFRKAEAISK